MEADPIPGGETPFRESRAASLVAVNLNTFWATAVILLAFGLWDVFADPAHWVSAFRIRALGVAVIVATGLVQKLPGRAGWMPAMAKVRLVVAVIACILAASMLDRGYGFGVAGMIAIVLTGPYIAIDSRDLRLMNALVLGTVVVMVVAAPLDGFDAAGTIVFALLAVLVSTLLGRVLETSNRRAFALEIEMQREARTDTLTGLANRRAMQERGLIELKRAKRTGAPVSMVLGDIDHFKRVNDRFGHETGDAVLRSVAQALRGTLRESDLIGRWGGEEFLAMLVETDTVTSREVAERMRAAVAALSFDKMPEKMTISLGVAVLSVIDDVPGAWETLLKDSDRQLYRAKSDGRNRVAVQA